MFFSPRLTKMVSLSTAVKLVGLAIMLIALIEMIDAGRPVAGGVKGMPTSAAAARTVQGAAAASADARARQHARNLHRRPPMGRPGEEDPYDDDEERPPLRPDQHAAAATPRKIEGLNLKGERA